MKINQTRASVPATCNFTDAGLWALPYYGSVASGDFGGRSRILGTALQLYLGEICPALVGTLGSVIVGLAPTFLRELCELDEVTQDKRTA